MRPPLNRGASNLSGILILIGIILIMLTTSQDNTDQQDSTGSNWVPGATLSGSNSRLQASSNPLVTIGSGNASYAYQSYEEYITLENRSRQSVDITGWQLRNGKDKRAYYSGSTLQRFSADVALIPQASRYLSPTGHSLMQNVVLQEGERAIVTTGSFPNLTPYKVTSFKENICSGYLEALPDYIFTPSLTQNCPQPEYESGIENLEISCRKFVENLRPCETPKLGEKDKNGDYCPNCVDGTALSSHCAAFVREHFSYQGCIAHHVKDSNFSGDTWRIFLGRGWEMWAEEYESIELFDRLGQLVNFENY